MVLLIVLLASALVAGCASSGADAYSTYSQGGQPQQQQYVGGGCGVAPSAEYSDASGILNSESSL